MIIKRLLSLAASMLCCVGTFTTYADTSAAGISDEIQSVNGTVFTIERPDASALSCLCDGNTFYRTCSQTLQVRTETPASHVIEGTGAEHIQISNNVFTECNFGGRGDVITIESLLNGERLENMPLADIRILNNEFNFCYQAPVNADNVDGLTVSGNLFRDCEDYQIGNSMLTIQDVNALLHMLA